MTTTTGLTVRPGQIIGFRPARSHERPGRMYPIVAIAGGSEPAGDEGAGGQSDPSNSGTSNDDGQGGSQTGTGQGDGGQSGSGSTGSSESKGGGDSKTDGKVEDLPDWAQKLIRDARKEAAEHRTGKNSAEQKYQGTLDAIAKALGLKQDEKLSPEDLAKQLEERDSELYRMRVERGMARACRKHGADEDLTVALLAHQGKLDDLDPSAKDFDAKLDALVKTAVDSNQKLRLTQAAGKSSVDHATGGGERRSDKPKSLAAAVTGHYGT